MPVMFGATTLQAHLVGGRKACLDGFSMHIRDTPLSIQWSLPSSWSRHLKRAEATGCVKPPSQKIVGFFDGSKVVCILYPRFVKGCHRHCHAVFYLLEIGHVFVFVAAHLTPRHPTAQGVVGSV